METTTAKMYVWNVWGGPGEFLGTVEAADIFAAEAAAIAKFGKRRGGGDYWLTYRT